MSTIALVRHDVLKPKRIGQYIIVREIGRGTTSVVYLGTTETGRLVAIKRLLPWHNSTTFRLMMRTEAQLAGKIKHKNVVSILDSKMEDPEGSYLVLDYVEGQGLDYYSSPETLLPINTVVGIIRQACEALSYAFHRGIVHRDIKPGNILLSDLDGTAKLTDFGCALIAGDTQTQIGIAGSLMYMSPEQINGSKVDYRSDIYSLGIVLYKLLCGQNPFPACETSEQLITSILTGNVTPLIERRDIPANITAIVERCMSVNPSDRYQSHEEILVALHHIVESSNPPPASIGTDIYNLMVKCHFFHNYPAQNMWEILHAGAIKRIGFKQKLVEDGDHGFSFFILLEGRVAVIRNGRLLGVVAAGDCIGENAVYGRTTLRGADIIALEDTKVLEITSSRAAKFSPESAALVHRSILISVIEKLSLANTRLVSMMDEQALAMKTLQAEQSNLVAQIA